MWIVFGTGVKATRVAGGARVDRRCEQCGEQATFYEKEVTSTFRLYFVDVFDYQRHRVMACGCCGVCYATDELGVPATRTGEAESSGSFAESAGRAVRGLGGYVDRAADAFEAGVSNLLSAREPETPTAQTRGGRAATGMRVGGGPALRRSPADEQVPADEDDAAPADARLRVPERKAGMRIKID